MNADHSGHGANRTATSAGIATYTCPMHPQIKRPDPGSCPICGMTLVAAGAEQVR